MENVFLLDAARAGHLIGLAIGLGPALCADALVVKSFFKPIQPRDLAMLRWLHKVVLVGLAIFWVSGLVLLQFRTGWEFSQFSPKLLLKLIVVILLTANAVAIGIYALPRFGHNLGRVFGQIDPPALLNLTIIGGLSISCWLSALALGAFSQLKPLGFGDLHTVFAPMFMVGLLGSILVGLGAVALSRNNLRDGVQPGVQPGQNPV